MTESHDEPEPDPELARLLREWTVPALPDSLDARVKDLRTAAFLNAVRKVATSYMELGIFP